MSAVAHFQLITLFPKVVDNFLELGVVGQAQKKNLIEVTCHNPRDYTSDVHHSVDDRPFGGGDGMCMLVEPLAQAVDQALVCRPQARRIYLSPQGRTLNQGLVQEFAQAPDLILLAGRYAGVDQRLLNQYQFEEVSVGDYVLSGGELAALVLMDAVARFIPGVLGHGESAAKDSFAGGLLEAPLFTRPRETFGAAVPEVLLSGNHARIEEWKKWMSVFVTLKKRPDLKPLKALSDKDLQKLKKFWSTLSEAELKAVGLAGFKWDF